MTTPEDLAPADLARWRADANALQRDALVTLDRPVAVVLLEAESTAALLRHLWSPAPGGRRPGLEALAASLPRSTAEDIDSLVRAARAAHIAAQLPDDRGEDFDQTRARALHVFGELLAACELVDTFDGRPQPSPQARTVIRQVRQSRAHLCQALDYIALRAHASREALGRLGPSFDPSLIGEARALADGLLREGLPRPGVEASPHIELRNRLLTLLHRRVSAVQRGARFVLRDHPALAALFASEHRRRRRQRGAAEGQATAAPPALEEPDA